MENRKRKLGERYVSLIGMRNQRVWVPVSDVKEKHARISLITF